MQIKELMPVVEKLIPVGVLVLASSAAMAGLVVVTPVTVTVGPDGEGIANGSSTAARFSKNAVEHIGCGVRRIEDSVGGVTEYGFCQAADAANVQGLCETQNPALIASIGDQDDYSFVTFSWDSDGICRSIGNSTRSFYIPDK